MSLALPQYQPNQPGRFDFRVPDNLGNYLYPDWDDPGLKVEFRDSTGTLRFTATTSSSPALSQEQDSEGYYVTVEGMDLTSFALGNAEASIYCQVNGEEVMPYPTILVAFQVIPALGPDPLYSTTDRVLEELPGDLPAELSTSVVAGFIADQSRRIDAYLRTCYAVPFPGIGDNPPTPALIERICRRLAAADCLRFLGRSVREGQPATWDTEALAELESLVPRDRQAPRLRLPGYLGPAPVYQGELSRDDQSPGDLLD
ncbi:MAG: hypothetical protein A2V67_20495 [Deltaproteobacteria bacterium RBG_13_61_14]|nr:MAG: hypothetical protein A2V67_20495 [Deltaproteobacteria bacterium RBG_13_61_14]